MPNVKDIITTSKKAETFLRVWIGFVAFMALANSFQCFFGSSMFLAEKLYNGKPELMNGLTARLFGMWTLLASIVRGYCSVYLHCRELYTVTMISFLLVFPHYIVEILEFKTCKLTVGVIAPLIISGISFLWMFIGQWFINFNQYERRSKSRVKVS